ncbi:ROK family protein [Leeuwenhoekiella marinoflava]|uniref:Glucokinase n=2 Tax=Leeuwenhoekiella marinoflava TaxID=988 RepID=A0A4Q0PGA6_9FLAO|nr:ROK family protein [Leeuwenhoekiella marinoflava]RXG25871.1 glucokinase [Leeuwenhoekiella marinoflava]SHG00292.1 glucokinase [Leeuwenhoekiella marinoflava DSM 3653]
MLSLGVDIGGSHIACCVFDHTSKELLKETFSYKKVNPHGTKDEILKTWLLALNESIAHLNRNIAGVGLAMPGPFDYYRGISKIKEVAKLQALYNVSLRLEIAQGLNMLPSQIRFINDASAFSIAEASLGKASAYKRIVAITLGTGLGASFAVNGMPVLKDKRVPDSGYLYNQYYKNILADELFSTRGIIEVYREVTGEQITNVKELYDEVAIDNQAKLVFENFGNRLGDFIKPYLEEFGAEALVLGGNISKAFDVFGESLKTQLPNLDELYVSEFGEEAAIIGGALLLDEMFYKKIEDTLKLM